MHYAITSSWSATLIQMAHILVFVYIYSEGVVLALVIERHYLGKLLLSKVALVILIKRLNMNIL